MKSLALRTLAVMLVSCTAAAWAYFGFGVPVTRTVLGISVGDVGFALQLVALAVGATCATATTRWRQHVLIAEGLVCLGAWGAIGAVMLAALVAWWGLLELRVLGRGRFVIAAAAIVGPSACALAGGLPADIGLVFAVMFGMRLAVYGYERWQDETPASLADFLSYVLLAPLIVIPPYMAFIPLFGVFTSAPSAPSFARIAAAARHAVLAALFAIAYLALRTYLVEPPYLRYYGRFIAELLDFAALAHLVLAVLLVHGIELRSPIDRPALATSFLDLWRRFGGHLREAQMFLFFTPAMLVLRRANRYLVLVLASAWTMIVGNTLLHVALRYCFLADPWKRIVAALCANTIMAAVIAIELCLDEHRRRRGGPSKAPAVAGWATTMTIAAGTMAI